MRRVIENRLHRVKIQLEKGDVKCEFSIQCDTSEFSDRCNQFFKKCSKYLQFKKLSQSF